MKRHLLGNSLKKSIPDTAEEYLSKDLVWARKEKRSASSLREKQDQVTGGLTDFPMQHRFKPL